MAVVVPIPKQPRHRRAKLNDTVIRRLRKGERVYDGSIPGLYAQSGERGVSFRVMADLPCRVHRQKLDGPQTLERTIGRYPDMTAKKARQEGARVIALIKSGSDPKEPQRGEGGPTLALAWADYRDDFMVKRGRSQKTVRFYEACFKRLKRWHDKPLGLLASNPQAIADEHERLTRAHRRKGDEKSDGHGAADGSIGFLKLIYNHAQGKAMHLPAWPTRAVVMHGPRSRAHRGLGAAQLSEWWRQVQRLDNPVRKELLLFTLLSGLRGNDVMTAAWANLEDANRTLLIPAPKGGERRAFHLPMSVAMLACVGRAREAWSSTCRPESSWLFPSARSKSGHFEDMRAQYVDDDGKKQYVKTGHDLRHSFANCAKDGPNNN